MMVFLAGACVGAAAWWLAGRVLDAFTPWILDDDHRRKRI